VITDRTRLACAPTWEGKQCELDDELLFRNGTISTAAGYLTARAGTTVPGPPGKASARFGPPGGRPAGQLRSDLTGGTLLPGFTDPPTASRVRRLTSGGPV